MVITEEDVDALNRASIARAAAFVRIAGSALVVVGAVGCLAWLWNVIRAQQQVSTSLRFALGGPGAPIEVDLVDRLDLFVSVIALLITSALAAGFGLLLRLVADFLVMRSGGTLTGFEPGDVVP
jgi:hypothetical protein